jgi:spermidine/putrescine transport system ATP-binding protein
VDKGFAPNEPVDVVVRPEDIYIFELSDKAQFTGLVTSSIFKGVHYEMMVTTPEGYEFLIQDYHCFEVGKTVGMLVKPFDIQVMKKERHCNTFEGTIVDKTHVRFLGTTFECADTKGLANGTEVKLMVDFGNINLQDNQEDGMMSGVVSFILYKGNHYHLTISTGSNENIFVDTNDIWDDGDRVGISIPAKSIHVEAI